MTDHVDELKYLDVVSEYKASKAGDVEGYGAIFGNVDKGMDMIQAGAFAESISNIKQVVMLWHHDSWSPIGLWTEIAEDAKGLRLKGSLIMDVQAGKEAGALITAGAVTGLSIGYRTLESRKAEIDGRDVRIIEKAELWEVSIVTFPMNDLAVIDAAKAATMTQRDLERALLSGSKPSRSVARALTGDGYKGVQALSGSGDEDYSELLDAMQASSLINALS